MLMLTPVSLILASTVIEGVVSPAPALRVTVEVYLPDWLTMTSLASTGHAPRSEKYSAREALPFAARGDRFRHLGPGDIVLVRRNRDCRKDADDRDNDHQLDEGEASLQLVRKVHGIPEKKSRRFRRLFSVHRKLY